MSNALIDFVRSMGYKFDLMSKGEYMVVSVVEEMYDSNVVGQYLIKKGLPESYDQNISSEMIIAPFRSVLLLTPNPPSNPNYDTFIEMTRNYTSRPPFSVYANKFIKTRVPLSAAYAYDAVMLYAKALNMTVSEGGDPYDGRLVISKVLNTTYTSILGHNVHMDEHGDAEGNWTILALKKVPGVGLRNHRYGYSMQPVARFERSDTIDLPQIKIIKPIDWIGGEPPKSEPPCGFYGEKCVFEPDWIIISCSSIAGVIVIIIITFIFRYLRYEHKLAMQLWTLDWREIELKDPTRGSLVLPNVTKGLQLGSNCILSPEESDYTPLCNEIEYLEDGTTDFPEGQVRFGTYRKTDVAIKNICRKDVNLTRTMRKELKVVRELRHDNLNPFIGASTEAPNICIVTQYCKRGSLDGVLNNEDFILDQMFKALLIADLIRGMTYLHESEIECHGRLKSPNCLIDHRWVLQISDYGLHEFKGVELYLSEQTYFRKKLWTAPELLRHTNSFPNEKGTQKGDIYAFGIILYELMARSGPFGNTSLTPKDIVKLVREDRRCTGKKPFRPDTSCLKCDDFIVKSMEECWHEDPDHRPQDFKAVQRDLKKMQEGMASTIVDNLLMRCEKYATHLEGLVQERTHLLVEEKKKTENLLHRMLPKYVPRSVAEQLVRGDDVEAESFDAVTIYFSDIVGFTSLSAESTPMQIVDLLNDLYTCFDSIIEHYDVYKVETIGDAYMVVSGLPIRNGNSHAGEIASMAVHLLSALKTFKIRHRPDDMLKVRIGIHSGPVVAGVVGQKMPRYCLFGDTVNTASRMETTGEALKIHVSEECKQILDTLGGYKVEERGEVAMKGKGMLKTYWLVGEDEEQKLSRQNRLVSDCMRPNWSTLSVRARSTATLTRLHSNSRPRSERIEGHSIEGPLTASNGVAASSPGPLHHKHGPIKFLIGRADSIKSSGSDGDDQLSPSSPGAESKHHTHHWPSVKARLFRTATTGTGAHRYTSNRLGFGKPLIKGIQQHQQPSDTSISITANGISTKRLNNTNNNNFESATADNAVINVGRCVNKIEDTPPSGGVEVAVDMNISRPGETDMDVVRTGGVVNGESRERSRDDGLWEACARHLLKAEEEQSEMDSLLYAPGNGSRDEARNGSARGIPLGLLEGKGCEKHLPSVKKYQSSPQTTYQQVSGRPIEDEDMSEDEIVV